MKRNGFTIQLCALVFVSTACLCICFTAFAQEAAPQAQEGLQKPSEIQQPSLLDTAGRTKFFLQAGFGGGFDSVHVGDTLDGDKITLSGGGGFALTLGFGYGLSSDLDLDFDLGGQISTITPEVSNADGSFSRSFLLATIRKKFPTSDSGQFKAGIGIGIYSNGELDLDWTGPGGNHEIVKYDDALGLHLTGEFERFIGLHTSVYIGGKLYFVNYKAASYTIDGSSTALDNLKGNVKDLNGSGLDAMIGVCRYF